MESSAIRCDRCNNPVPEGDIDRALALAHCPACEHVFAYGAALVGAPRPVPDPPPSVTIAQDGSRLVVVWRWASPRWIVLALFSAAWDAMLIGFVANAVGSGLALWNYAIHGLVGAVMSYAAVAGLVNRTTFTVGDGHLRVAHGPLWWPGAQDLPLGDVKQLSTRRVVRKTKNGEQVTYTLDVKIGSVTVPLLPGIPDLAVAHWLERKIEAHLGIVDTDAK